MKRGDNINNATKNNNLSLADMKLKMHGMDTYPSQGGGAGGKAMPNPFSIFHEEQENFLQNQVRSVDLSEEERAL